MLAKRHIIEKIMYIKRDLERYQAVNKYL
jgi:hypothetical protein